MTEPTKLRKIQGITQAKQTVLNDNLNINKSWKKYNMYSSKYCIQSVSNSDELRYMDSIKKYKDMYTRIMNKELEPPNNAVQKMCKACLQGIMKYQTTVQTRSADEGSTVFFKCTNPNCGKRTKL